MAQLAHEVRVLVCLVVGVFLGGFGGFLTDSNWVYWRTIKWKESGGKVAVGPEELEERVGSGYQSKLSAILLIY
jgi:hypothetical protein